MSDTIVALATPIGRSGIGVIRLSGSGSLPIVSKLTGDVDLELEPRRVYLKRLRDPDTLDTLIALLEGMGHWAAGCSSAELALSRYLEGAFDIVITDVELPGISGRELAATLSLEGGIPIIFATVADM